MERNIFDVENESDAPTNPNKLHYRTMASVTDGTSNTMVVAEQSGRICSAVAGNMLLPIHSNHLGPWHGGRDSKDMTITTGLVTTWTARPINSKTCYDAMSGSGNVMAPNTILNSEHSGGINILLGDGSVRFMSETVSNNVYWPISNMNDGFSFSL